MNETINIDNTVIDEKARKKAFRKTVGYMGWGLLLYILIEEAVVTIMTYIGLNNCSTDWRSMSDEEYSAFFDDFFELGPGGMISCVSVLIGIIFLFLYFRKKISLKEIFSSHKKMLPASFGMILCVFLGIQWITEPIFQSMENAFNQIGFSIETSMDDASSGALTLTMLAYSAIAAPLVEELIYRGFVLSTLKKYGKLYAIVISALLFGIMHGNLPQAVYAFIVGLLLGYVAVEYSIRWTILLHVINNSLADLLYYLGQNLSDEVNTVIFYAIFGISCLIGVFIIIKKRRSILKYIKENSFAPSTFFRTFTLVGLMLFIIMNLYTAFSMIEKI